MSCMCFECVSGKGLDNPPELPDGWHIERNVKPIPSSRFDYDFYHDNYDGADGGNGLFGNAANYHEAVMKIWSIENDLRGE